VAIRRMTEPRSVQPWPFQMSRASWPIMLIEKWPTGTNERNGGENQKPGLIRAGLASWVAHSARQPRTSWNDLRRDRLSYFAHEKGLQVRLRTGPLQAIARFATMQLLAVIVQGSSLYVIDQRHDSGTVDLLAG
jgi:hypothetical protein